MALCVVASPLDAQKPARIAIRADSLARLTRPLSPQARIAAMEYVSGTDSSAQFALRSLHTHRAGLAFLLSMLPFEPSPQLRRTLISTIQSDSLPPQTVLAALRDRVQADSSPAVVLAAIEGLRAVSLRQTNLPALLASRMAAARAAKDTAVLRVLLEADDYIAHLDRGIHAPAFLRTPPPLFAAAPSGGSVRVVAFGDYGTAHLSASSTHQAEVARILRAYHAEHPFTFGITTGDNFYPTSFPSAHHPAWKVSWEDMYAALGIPFYISLGNHDWGEGAGPLAQHIYAQTSESWKLPAFYYTYTAGPAQFFAINTNAVTERQLEWLRAELSKSTAKWKIVYGHHPAYEQTNYGVERQQRLLLPILKEHKVDMYVAGHHHTMQHWQMDGIDFVVSGAGGAANYGLGDTTQAIAGRKFMASRPGFADLTVSESELTLRFVGIGPVTIADRRTGTNAPGGPPVVLYEYRRKR